MLSRSSFDESLLLHYFSGTATVMNLAIHGGRTLIEFGSSPVTLKKIRNSLFLLSSPCYKDNDSLVGAKREYRTTAIF